MKILKVTALLIGLFVVAVFAMAAMQDKHFRIERSTTINASPTRVFPYIGELQKWEVWSPWRAEDPSVKNSYEGPASGVGATSKWTSDKMGSGQMTMTEFVPDSKVKVHLTFIEPMPSENDADLTLTPEGDATRVSWSMEGEHNLIGRVFWILFRAENMLNSDFDLGLSLMKKAVEGT